MLRTIFGALAALAMLVAPARAQDFPNRVIKIVVPFGAGGVTDLYIRMLGEQLRPILGQAIIVENRPGQGGSLGPASVAKAEPDGYTLVAAGTGNNIGETLYKNLSFSILKDFVPVVYGVDIVNVLIVRKDLPANNVKELIALAKASPGKLQYASSGHGGVYHLAMELFRHMAGIDMLHVPYRTEPAGRTDVVAGRMDAMVTAYGVILPNLESKQVRALAVTGNNRFPPLKDVPTVAEAGDLPGYNGDAYIGLLAPAGTPAPVVRKINDAVTQVQRRPEFRAKLAEVGLAAVERSPEEFSAYLRDEVAKWKKIIEASGTKVN